MIKIQVPLTIEDRHKHFEKEFIRAAKVRGITVKKVLDSGPSGGWPEYEISSEDIKEFYSFMADVGFDADDVDLFKVR